MIKLVLNFMQKNEKQMNELGGKKVLVDTLCLHLDVMTKNMDMKGDVEVIKTLLEYDWKRLSNLQVTIDTVIRKCDFGPVSDLKMVKKAKAMRKSQKGAVITSILFTVFFFTVLTGELETPRYV